MAARVRGEKSTYIIAFEIIPMLTSLIVASFLGTAVFAVLTAAGLQFVGLGNPNSLSWGNMLYWAQNNEALDAGSPLWAIVPGVCIALLGGAFAFLNYAFDEISNPALRPVRRLSHRRSRRVNSARLEQGTGATGTRPLGAAPKVPAAGPDRWQDGPITPPQLWPTLRPVRPSTTRQRPDLCSRCAVCPWRTLPRPAAVAVDAVDLDLDSGEFLAVVGESGCGKSTLMYAMAQLLNPPAHITAGTVVFKGNEMAQMSDQKLRHVRWREFSVVMQSAMNALNPVMTVGEQMKDACKAHSPMSRDAVAQRSAEVLRLVSIDPVHLGSYPHQLSGGMRQRSMIAMALLFTPQLVIMDEPTSALDVVAQRSLMRQIKALQHRLGFAVVFVTHDISLVRHFSDRVLVMYAGQVAELGRTTEVFGTPRHPYSRALLEAFPSVRGEKVALTGIAGAPPNLASPPPGCRFHPRCADAMPECSSLEPPAYTRGGSLVRCLLYKDGGGETESLAGQSARSLGQSPSMARTTVPATATPIDQNGQQAPLLEVSDLTLHFNLGAWWAKKTLHAVDDVSFTIGRKEIVALVGESGSGKTTVARILAMAYKPTKGEVRFEGKALTTLQGKRENSPTGVRCRWCSKTRLVRSTPPTEYRMPSCGR